jgi:hypothetical protein
MMISLPNCRIHVNGGVHKLAGTHLQAESAVTSNSDVACGSTKPPLRGIDMEQGKIENTDWRTDLKIGSYLEDEELRLGIDVRFLEDSPTLEQSQYGPQRVFKVEAKGIERKLRANNRLARALAKCKNLKGKVFNIKRLGEGFKTTYEVKEVK